MMNDTTGDQWLSANQRYLMAAIQSVRAELLDYQASTGEDPSQDASKQAIEAAKKEMQEAAEALPVPAALDMLVDLFGLSPFEQHILLMCAGVELDAHFARLLQELSGDAAQNLPTFSLALSALPEAHWSATAPEGPLRYWRLIEVHKSPLLTNSPLSIDEYILHFLTGVHYPDPHLQDIVQVYAETDELADSHQKVADELVHFISHFSGQDNAPLIQLIGSTEDKTAIAAEAFARFQLTTYILPLHLLPLGLEELAVIGKSWNRMAALNGCALFMDGSHLEGLDQRARQLLLHFINGIQGIAVLGGDKQISDIKRGVVAVDVAKPLRTEQKALWMQSVDSTAENADEVLEELVTQFNLDTHTIRNLAQTVILSTGDEAEGNVQIPPKEKLWNVCCRHTRPQLDLLAQRIDPVARWEDLVLPDTQKSILKEISLHVKNRQKVYYNWGFAGKSARGLGISALFSGDSGTGKTMASEVLANDLALDLYRIDLSQVVNKYIGETEKNLKKIFDAAEESGAILLFDEADALFGKRSEVKDSHDRYSNIEVSYLLQRMETYRGLAILTTNMKNALDKAFLRRIRFLVNFPFPDAATRAGIWQKVFPSETPTLDLNIGKLACLNIAGGNIRNIALNASFLAADENRPVGMQDIYQAARTEYAKMEKQMSSAENFYENGATH
jgi:hypothetical protein